MVFINESNIQKTNTQNISTILLCMKPYNYLILNEMQTILKLKLPSNLLNTVYR